MSFNHCEKELTHGTWYAHILLQFIGESTAVGERCFYRAQRGWRKCPPTVFSFTFSAANIPNSEVAMCIELFPIINYNNAGENINHAVYRFVNAFLPKSSSV